MEYEITPEMIVNEFLSNWFTFDELSQYLCIDKDKIEDVLLNISNKKILEKVKRHADLIFKYYTEENIVRDYDAYSMEIIDMADYIINNNASFRKTAEHYNIGKTTVFDRIYEKLPAIDLKRYHDVFIVLMKNKSFDTNNKKITENVLECAQLLLQGLTCEEICESMNISRNVLQRNLTLRLKNINLETYLKVKEILKERQLEGLVPFEKGKSN